MDIFGHFRRILVFVVNFLLNRPTILRFVGHINKRLPFLKSVFVAYGASEEYSYAYVYPKHRHFMKWKPWIAGIFKQNGKWGLMMVVSSLEEDFHDLNNTENLKLLLDSTENIRVMLNAPQKSFAGILPGIFFMRRLIRESVEADVTVYAVAKALAEVEKAEGCDKDTPIIVLGGRGFIGRRFVKKVECCRRVYSVDLVDNGDGKWPEHLFGQKVIMVNIAKTDAVLSYPLWPGVILLNEAYPAPSGEGLEKLTSAGCAVYHVVGVKAMSLPSFPHDYMGGIPCCAAWNSNEMEVLVKRLGRP